MPWAPNPPRQAFASFFLGFEATIRHPVRGLRRCRLAPFAHRIRWGKGLSTRQQGRSVAIPSGLQQAFFIFGFKAAVRHPARSLKRYRLTPGLFGLSTRQQDRSLWASP